MMQTVRKFDTPLGSVLEDGGKIMFLIFSAAALLVCLGYQLLAIPHPFSLDYGEAPLVDQAMRLASGKKVSALSGSRAAANGTDSFVSKDFPAGITDIPVKSGQLLSYQGIWSGTPQWVYVFIVLVDAYGKSSQPQNVTSADLLDPAPYLGLIVESGKDSPQPLKCKEP